MATHTLCLRQEEEEVEKSGDQVVNEDEEDVPSDRSVSKKAWLR